MIDRVGQQIGNYKLTRLLGRGGFAEVYLGTHIYLKTQIALKLLYGKLTPQDVQSFIQEAQTIAALKHPHIVRVFDFGVEQMMPYIIMDYASSGTMRDRYPSGKCLPLPQILSHVKQMASALAYTHERNLIHRDVKPENMLLDEQSQVLLSDFGIATVAHSTASMQTQDSIGTVHYMAPEQLRGYPTPASDQYSLGIVVYEWLCGERPFQGANFIEIGMKQATELPPSLRQKNSTLSPEIEQVVFKALAKNAKQRFPHIQDFVQALERALHGNSLTTTIMSPKQPLQLDALSNTSVLSHSTSNRNPAISTISQSTPSSIGTLLYRYSEHKKGRLSPASDIDSINTICWSPDSTCVASRSSIFIHVWNVRTGQVERKETGMVVALSPDGTRLVTGEGEKELQVWSTKTWNKLQKFPLITEAQYLSYSPNGQYILALSSSHSDQAAHIYEASSRRHLTRFNKHSGDIRTACWSPDSSSIASAGEDEAVQIWSATEGKALAIYQEYKHRILAVAWSPNGKYIACAGLGGEVHVWEVTIEKAILVYTQHSKNVNAIAWSPDSRLIASASDDRTVRIWEVIEGESIYVYQQHNKRVETVSWSPDGSCISSGGGDVEVHIWQAP
jgi:serine/threonine protein kinase